MRLSDFFPLIQRGVDLSSDAALLARFMVQHVGHCIRSDAAAGPRDKVVGNRFASGKEVPPKKERNGQSDLHG